MTQNSFLSSWARTGRAVRVIAAETLLAVVQDATTGRTGGARRSATCDRSDPGLRRSALWRPRRGPLAVVTVSLVATVMTSTVSAAPSMAQTSVPADPAYILDNGVLRFGGLVPAGQDPATSQERPGRNTPFPSAQDATAQRVFPSVEFDGRLSAPFYAKDENGDLRLFGLTNSQKPLDLVIGVGRDSNATFWHENVERKASDSSRNPPNTCLTNKSAIEHIGCPFPWDTPGTLTSAVSSSGPNRGVGSITFSGARVTVAGIELEVTKVYTLEEGDPFVRIRTTIANRSAGIAENVRFWAAVEDDFINFQDSNRKARGNLRASGFVPLTSASDPSNTILVRSGDSGVLFFTTFERADALFDRIGPSFPDTNPEDSGSNASACNGTSRIDCDDKNFDGSYALAIELGDMAAGEALTFDYYFSAGALTDLNAAMARLFVTAFAPTVSWDVATISAGGSATLTYGSVADGFVCDFINEVVVGCRVVDAGSVGESWAALHGRLGAGVYTVRSYGGDCAPLPGTSECDPVNWKSFEDPFGGEAQLVITAGATLAVACDPNPGTVGSTVTCTVTGADAGIDFLWSASEGANPRGGAVTMDARGTGQFQFVVTRSALGGQVQVELVAWGVGTTVATSGPVPRTIPAGEGPASAVLPASLLLAALAFSARPIRRSTRRCVA